MCSVVGLQSPGGKISLRLTGALTVQKLGPLAEVGASKYKGAQKDHLWEQDSVDSANEQ